MGHVPLGIAEAEIYCFPALINPLKLLETGQDEEKTWVFLM